MNRELKIKIVHDLIEDQAKAVIESNDLDDDMFEEVEEFLQKCLDGLEMMIHND
jgi:hypothetical protein